MAPIEISRERESFNDFVEWLRQRIAAGTLGTAAEKFRAYAADKEKQPRLRYLHDKFGWMAKGTWPRGQCAGTIYRTEEFILGRKRIGAKKKNASRATQKSIHLEHTVPIRALCLGLNDYCGSGEARDARELFEWVMKHSICTAMSHDEEGRVGTGSTTGCFDSDTGALLDDHPFRRYSGHNMRIWNMITGELVSQENWTFADHCECMASVGIYAWPATK